jgi:hypothetical protein
LVLLLSALVSLVIFTKSALGSLTDPMAFHLEGTQYITSDEQKNRMLQEMTQTRRATFLSGKCVFCYNEAPALAVFTGNRSYIAWSYFESLTDYSQEAKQREQLNNDFYSGAMTDRLRFLQDNKIAGVLIWPDDNISDDFLATLRKELDPAYAYVDCKGAGDKNAGLFLLRALPQH